jgi:CheY-like chemotaxis protein
MPATVLVADNDPGVRALLAEIAARTGARVLTAEDGEAAIARLREQRVDVLVCDLDMPKKAGIDVLRFASALAPAPVAVVVSGYLDAATVAQLQAMPSVKAQLKKPFDVLAFAALLQRLAAGATGETGAAGEGAA